MIAYKFLRSGRVGPFSGFQWPEPDVLGAIPRRIWPPADVAFMPAGPATSRGGWLTSCGRSSFDGHVQVDEHKIIAAAGRLRSRIEAWTPACAQEYADACAWRAQGRAVEALAHAGHRRAARQLEACATLDDALLAARQLADDIPETRISLTIAGDGAVRALTGAPPTSAYIAAHAAMRLDGPAGYAAERTWQSQWLVERLGLRADQ